MSSPDGHIDGADPLVGQILLDRYRIVRKLEARRGAALYLAQHVHADRPLAVQVVEADHAGTAVIDQFLEDARTVARVGHENIVEIFNGGRSPQGVLFLATELLEGTSLARAIEKEGPSPWDRAQGIVLQIAAALGAVHRHGVAHGDLCSETVLIVPREGRRDFVKLIDVGVARVRASETSPAADLYALGRLTYELVTGRPPAADATGKINAPSALRPAGTLPPDLDAVVLRALEKDPSLRWPDVAAFGEAIARCRLTRRQSVRVEALTQAEQSGKINAFETDARRRRRLWSISSVAAAVAIAIAVLRVLLTAPGHVQISTVPTDADLTFNGLPVQARSPVVLDAAPGRYTLVVSRAGFLTAERLVEVAARSTVTVPVQLVSAPTAPPAAVDSPPGEPAAPAP